ncbi:MAG: PepSY domain-containing protein, partial [Paraglaciecola chathamensis]
MSVNNIKRWVFWAHLVTGLVAGMFVFCMAFTGVLLTYERQIVELSEMHYRVSPSDSARRLTTDEVVNVLQQLHPDEPHIYIRWVNKEGAAIPVWAGKNNYLLHPYTGKVLRVGEGAVTEFFHQVTDLHRYLLLTGDSRA